ncbi:MAG: class I SAM-dependent methyltransferase [Planctomycetota bacterium]
MAAWTLAERPCPGCGSFVDRGPEVRSLVRPADLSPDELATRWGPSERNDAFFDYVRCSECALLHNRIYLTPDELGQAYEQMEDNTAGQPLDLLRRTQQRYLDVFQESGSLAGAYLELGPDIGLVASAAAESGELTAIDFVEPNRAAHAHLRGVTDSCPVGVVASVEDLPAQRIYDHLVLIHVLDHLLEPRSVLRELRSRLHSGATALVVVHDEASVLRRLLGRRWPPFRLQHPQLFSPATLTGLINESGFDVERTGRTTNSISLRHLVGAGLSLTGWDPKWLRSIPEVGLTLRLGNILAVARAR